MSPAERLSILHLTGKAGGWFFLVLFLENQFCFADKPFFHQEHGLVPCAGEESFTPSSNIPHCFYISVVLFSSSIHMELK